jgi:hypothetical protein
MDKIGALVEQLISIKDGFKGDLYNSQLNALNDACNLIYYSFPSDAYVYDCIKESKNKRKEERENDSGSGS